MSRYLKKGVSGISPIPPEKNNLLDLVIEVLSDRIITEVYQENGWVRKNFYYPEECTTEELFQGKWKQSQKPNKKRFRGER